MFIYYSVNSYKSTRMLRFFEVCRILTKGSGLMYSIFEQLLQKHGVSSYKVSKDTGIAQSVLSDWKNGKSQIKQDKLQILADYFGVSLNYMMGLEEKETYENELEAKNATEKELLLLCRKVNDAPEEVKEQILNQFKSTIDIYLKAKGIK